MAPAPRLKIQKKKEKRNSNKYLVCKRAKDV